MPLNDSSLITVSTAITVAAPFYLEKVSPKPIKSHIVNLTKFIAAAMFCFFPKNDLLNGLDKRDFRTGILAKNGIILVHVSYNFVNLHVAEGQKIGSEHSTADDGAF